MNDPRVNELMPHIRQWLAMPVEQAKDAITKFMKDEGGYARLDFDFVQCSETAEDAIGLVFGI